MEHIKKNDLRLLVIPLILVFILGGNLFAFSPFACDRSSLGVSGQVIVVYDGDTVKIRFENGVAFKARLIGIDAPEIEDERKEVKFLAYTAKRFAFFHLYGKRVKIEYDWERMDKYGRLLVYLWTDEEGLFNEFILSEGFASVLTKFPFKEAYKERFIAAERRAKDLKKGFWTEEPLLTIAAEEAHSHVGKLLSVQFLCVEVRTRGNFVYLDASQGFSAIVPRAQISLFPEIGRLEGKVLSVKGFLETHRGGEPQVMVFLPLQMDIGE